MLESEFKVIIAWLWVDAVRSANEIIAPIT
jgi:hypothetical protein